MDEKLKRKKTKDTHTKKKLYIHITKQTHTVLRETLINHKKKKHTRKTHQNTLTYLPNPSARAGY